MVLGGMTVVVELDSCFVWFSEKPCLLMTTSEGSLSVSDLLAVVGVVGAVAVGGGGGAVAVDVVGVEVCAVAWCPLLLLLLLWFLSSLSSAAAPPSASLSSCWYMSSTMGFHNRTLAFMNQFDTCTTQRRSKSHNLSTSMPIHKCSKIKF